MEENKEEFKNLVKEENFKLLRTDIAIIYNVLNKEMEEVIRDEQSVNLYVDDDRKEMKTKDITFKRYEEDYIINYDKIEYLKKVIKKYLKKKEQRFSSKKLIIEIDAYYNPIIVSVKYENEEFRFIVI